MIAQGALAFVLALQTTIIAGAAVVLALILLIAGIFLFRSGKKKDSDPAGRPADWQRQPDAAAAWQQQAGSNAAWGQQQAQQPAGWGAPSTGGQPANPWGAANVGAQQQQSNPWGAANVDAQQQQNNPWGQQAQPQAQQPWGQQQQSNPWGQQAQAQSQPGNEWGAAAPASAAQQQSNPWGQQQAQQQNNSWGQQAQAQQQSNPWGQPANVPAQQQAQQSNPWGAANPQAQPWEQTPAPAAQDAWAQPQANQGQSWGQPAQQGPASFGGGSGQSWNQPAAPFQQAQPAANAAWPQPGGFGVPADSDKTVLRGVSQPGIQPGLGGALGYVRVEEGKEPGRIFEVRKESLSIGRSRESDIFLEDLAVSRLHATIVNMGNGNYMLKDEGSANGTKVNGQLVNKFQTYQLQEGDRVQLGQTVLVFGRK
ncbi:FHA domain-containing protein [Tengunoibacter tsumagoiensis]|uniref:FHA domain-containing protein n=1 Tax=Tengunoibacter tsumagoiensis TaxID=2014871 RepID=A0A401ZX88_9CHLR|nr:FHA domain-containing protein [Tengunoibacter tsumagoiensis]GCE11453.1 hypothetical protein KTT_13120 [Tengunoibacter tsumagoiensis]